MSNRLNYSIESLGSHHNRAAFSCRTELLNVYLQRYASQDAKKHLAAPFVLVEKGSSTVIGYYTLSALSINIDDLPTEISKKLPKYPQVPATLLGRLAVDKNYEGKGFGEILLMDALRANLENPIASMAVVVDAKDDKARSFYEHYEFIQFPNSPYRLFLTMKTIEELFRA